MKENEIMIEAIPTVSTDEITRIFEAQKVNAYKVAQSNYRERIAKLKKVQQWLETNETSIQTAIYKDFKKSAGSVTVTELVPLFGELSHTIKNLEKWMKPTKVAAPLPLFGTTS